MRTDEWAQVKALLRGVKLCRVSLSDSAFRDSADAALGCDAPGVGLPALHVPGVLRSSGRSRRNPSPETSEKPTNSLLK